MNTKHTPAPWFVSKSPAQRSSVANLNGRIFKSIKDKGGIGGKIVANAYGGTGIITQKSIEECEANAKLIAAAPELLEALIDLNWLIEQGATIEEIQESIKAKALPAIKKATE